MTVDVLWKMATGQECTTGTRFSRASATLTDVGLVDEASIGRFVCSANAEFGEHTLSVDTILMMTDPSLGAIAAYVEQAVRARAAKKPGPSPKMQTGSLQPAVRSVGLLLLAALGVAQGSSCASSAPSHAAFTFQDFGSYKMVNSTACGHSYVLYPRETTPPDLGTEVRYFGVPLQSVVLTQTVPVAYIEAVGARAAIKVASPYTTSACLAKMVGDGTTETYVSAPWDASSAPEQQAAHEAQMANEAHDAIFSDPWGSGSWGHAESASKLICAAATYETDPVAGAEWVKFFGYFFDASPSAEASFCATSSRYACNSLVASSIASEAAKSGSPYSYQVPMALFASKDYYGQYSIQMTPYKNKAVMDAGATYPNLAPFKDYESMHWSGAYTQGFKFPAENASIFHEVLALADVIIDESYPNGKTLDDLVTDYGLASSSAVPAFAAGRVYTLDGTMDSNGPPYGGTDFYESRTAEADRFLADLIAVFHPTNGDYQPSGLVYLRHAKNGSPSLTSASSCADVTAPRPVRSSTCEELATSSDAVLEWLDTFDTYKSPPPSPPYPPPPPPPSPPPPSPPPSPSLPSSSGLATEYLVIIIVLGALFALTLVCAGVLFMQRKPANKVGV